MLGALLPLLANLFRLLVVKILAALGLAFVSYTGYDVALGVFKRYISGSLNSMPADIANLLLMAGVGEGLGYVFGALAFAIAMQAMNKLTLAFGRS